MASRLLRNAAKALAAGGAGLGAAAVLQGSYFIARYRLNHGEAPRPISPARGMVVVGSNDTKERDEGQLPLKLFVVGDSLAAGCGIARSSIPILPESIARHLARELGRPVQWSCVGTPGASTKGIINMIHKWFTNNGESSVKNESDNADYDVVVVLAGMNDVKDTCLPFLAYERSELTYGDGLKKICGVLREKLRLNKKMPVRGDQQLPQRQRSLVVLPALPTTAIPLLSYPPIGLIANSVISYMDSAKQKLSQERSGILFVEAPSESLIQNIENGTSKLCLHRFKSGQYLRALHDIKSDVSQKIVRLMQEHSSAFERHGDCETEVECDQALNSHLRPEIPELLGSSLVSYDSIHPNDKGYDYWGRHIAAAILDEWKGQRNTDEQKVSA